MSSEISHVKAEAQSAQNLRRRAEEIVRLEKELAVIDARVEELTQELSYSGSTKTVEEVQLEIDNLQTEE